jgi:hypothetical protein
MGQTRNVATSRWPAWLNATALLLASVVAVGALSLQTHPGAEVVAVAFPLSWSSQQVFEAAASAHAAIVRTTALTAILVVRPDGHEGLARLHQAGAWLTIDPQAIAGCFTNPGKEI